MESNNWWFILSKETEGGGEERRKERGVALRLLVQIPNWTVCFAEI